MYNRKWRFTKLKSFESLGQSDLVLKNVVKCRFRGPLKIKKKKGQKELYKKKIQKIKNTWYPDYTLTLFLTWVLFILIHCKREKAKIAREKVSINWRLFKYLHNSPLSIISFLKTYIISVFFYFFYLYTCMSIVSNMHEYFYFSFIYSFYFLTDKFEKKKKLYEKKTLKYFNIKLDCFILNFTFLTSDCLIMISILYVEKVLMILIVT